MARLYRQSKRESSAEETRAKIVRATFELHAEQGIAATSMKQIAARAGVSVGSVYHHFPTYDDAILACGAHVATEVAPPPTPAIFDGAADRAERVRRLALALFETFEAVPVASVIADAEKLPVLRPFADQEREGRLALAALAAGDPKLAPTLAALLDVGTYEAFRRLGFNTLKAAKRAAEVANAWLEAQPPQKED